MKVAWIVYNKQDYLKLHQDLDHGLLGQGKADKDNSDQCKVLHFGKTNRDSTYMVNDMAFGSGE